MFPQIASRIVQIDQFVAQASGKDVPEQIQSHLSRFGAVLVCGLIERSVEHVILERLAGRAHPRVLRFIRSHFQRGSNYDCEAIEQLLRRFDNEWGERFHDFVSNHDEIREGIASVYAVRNSVAHGGTNSMGLTRLKELFSVSKELIESLHACTA
jgi:hypothetical protein